MDVFRDTLGPFRSIGWYSVRLTFSRPQAMMPVSPSRTSTSLCPPDIEGQIISLSTLQDQALLAELRRLLQVCQRQGRGLPPMPPGTSTIPPSIANHDKSNAPQFYHAFRSLCPKAWTDRWDGQRGTYPPTQGNFIVHLLTDSLQRPATSPLTLTGK